MKIKKRKEIQITLILSEEEAVWLKNLIQNPMIQQEGTTCLPAIESKEDTKMRKLFWDALVCEGIDV